MEGEELRDLAAGELVKSIDNKQDFRNKGFVSLVRQIEGDTTDGHKTSLGFVGGGGTTDNGIELLDKELKVALSDGKARHVSHFKERDKPRCIFVPVEALVRKEAPLNKLGMRRNQTGTNTGKGAANNGSSLVGLKKVVVQVGGEVQVFCLNVERRPSFVDNAM